MRKNGQVRIIGGRWRSRRLKCAAAPGLRPSPDALRETLFNWLARDLPGASCLDLFAGSGALGFEAASRGAAHVMLVESHPRAVAALRANRAALQAEREVAIFAGSAQRFLRGGGDRGGAETGDSGGSGPPHNSAHYDIVFLDPPFATPELLAFARAHLRPGLLNPGALVYAESPAALTWPADWRIIRRKRCGAAQSTLLQT